MPVIQKPNNLPLDPKGVMGVPAWMVPSFRTLKAAETNMQFNILIKAHGGVGDVICSEPAIRYAIENFKSSRISLLSPYPELFRHLPFHEVWKNGHDDPHCGIDLSKYLMFQTIDVTNELSNEFICHALMSGVDFASLNMWRLILPNHMKRIQLQPLDSEYDTARTLSQPNDVIVHPGKTWKSRTFPKKWWDAVLSGLIQAGARPVIIGGDIDKGRATTVDVNPDGCLDLRFKQTLMETCAYMHLTKVVLTNDSSPVHMASTGNSWIGYLSTVKHRDHLTHWRRPKVDLPNSSLSDWDLPHLPSVQLVDTVYETDLFGWRMSDFAKGALYQDIEVCPNNPRTVHVDGVETLQLLRWLPEPSELVKWAVERL